MTDQPTGIFFDIAADDYRQRPGINISSLKAMAISPAHYYAEVTRKPEEPTEAQVMGTITHSAILEDDFSGFHVRPLGMNFTTKEGKAWRDGHTDKPIITQQQADHIAGMLKSVAAHPLASKLLCGQGHNEVSAWAVHGPTGLLLKGRADRIASDSLGKTVIVDLKTTGYGEGCLDEFPKQMANWKYHRQAAHYLDLFGASFFVFLVVEKLPPYAVACYCVDEDDIKRARFENLRDLRAIVECRQSGKWPAYGNELVTIKLPHWAKKEIL